MDESPCAKSSCAATPSDIPLYDTLSPEAQRRYSEGIDVICDAYGLVFGGNTVSTDDALKHGDTQLDPDTEDLDLTLDAQPRVPGATLMDEDFRIHPKTPERADDPPTPVQPVSPTLLDLVNDLNVNLDDPEYLD